MVKGVIRPDGQAELVLHGPSSCAHVQNAAAFLNQHMIPYDYEPSRKAADIAVWPTFTCRAQPNLQHPGMFPSAMQARQFCT